MSLIENKYLWGGVAFYPASGMDTLPLASVFYKKLNCDISIFVYVDDSYSNPSYWAETIKILADFIRERGGVVVSAPATPRLAPSSKAMLEFVFDNKPRIIVFYSKDASLLIPPPECSNRKYNRQYDYLFIGGFLPLIGSGASYLDTKENLSKLIYFLRVGYYIDANYSVRGSICGILDLHNLGLEFVKSDILPGTKRYQKTIYLSKATLLRNLANV